jgi:hypothetical protein
LDQAHTPANAGRPFSLQSEALGPAQLPFEFGGKKHHLRFMSWRAGTQLFWDFWPKVKAAIQDEEQRACFARGLLKLFLDNDIDPCDLQGKDPEIDRLMDEIDPEL